MEKFIKLTKKYPDKDWYWNKISLNPNLTIEVIEKYPDKPWVGKIFQEIKYNNEIIENNPNKP